MYFYGLLNLMNGAKVVMDDQAWVARAAWPRARKHACHGTLLAHFRRPSALLSLSLSHSLSLGLALGITAEQRARPACSSMPLPSPSSLGSPTPR